MILAVQNIFLKRYQRTSAPESAAMLRKGISCLYYSVASLSLSEHFIVHRIAATTHDGMRIVHQYHANDTARAKKSVDTT